MTPIRPQVFAPPARPPEPARNDEARLAAQRAFFAAAVGKAPAPQAVAAAAPTAQAARIPDPAAPAPERILRPGSLLDIRV